MTSRRFYATYVGFGRCSLYCPRCGTRETAQLATVHDFAAEHARWWHPGPTWAYGSTPRWHR